MQGASSFWESLVIQWRVVRALLMREIITRYGRHNIGFFWLFVEPTIFCCGVMEIRVLFHESVKGGLPMAAFAITGYSTVLLWRNCGNHCSGSITPNLSLLYHHNVRVIDVLASRIILELAGCAMSFMMLMIVFGATGIIKPPEDWILLMAGYLLMAWFAGALAIWVCAMTELSEVFERIWHPITYFMLPISGLAFMVDWLPQKYQKLAMAVPMVNGVEMIRDGYFGKVVRCHYSALYLVCWSLGLTLTGLTLLKIFARTVEPQ